MSGLTTVTEDIEQLLRICFCWILETRNQHPLKLRVNDRKSYFRVSFLFRYLLRALNYFLTKKKYVISRINGQIM